MLSSRLPYTSFRYTLWHFGRIPYPSSLFIYELLIKLLAVMVWPMLL